MYSCPRGWSLSSSWEPNYGPLWKSPNITAQWYLAVEGVNVVTRCLHGVDTCDAGVSKRLTGQHVYLATPCRLWRQFTSTGQRARFSVFGSCVMRLAERDWQRGGGVSSLVLWQKTSHSYVTVTHSWLRYLCLKRLQDISWYSRNLVVKNMSILDEFFS